MRITAVIMAGGRGERFWPQSRINRPKQFLSLTSDGETMIQKTVGRLSSLVEISDIFIVTNKNYVGIVREQIPSLPEENILAEPASRNTAPCIGLAANVISKKYGEDTIMLVLPSDHLIKFNALFINTLKQAISVAEKGDNIVTIGVIPTYPEPGYGYIHFSNSNSEFSDIYKVIKFVEKPNIELAKKYVNSGEYLWNSGIFVWKVSTVLNNIKEFIPDIFKGLEDIFKFYGTENFEKILNDTFPTLQSISIDFGIMESARKIFTIPGNFGWDDVGSWLALERINSTNEYGNVVEGDVISIGTKHSTIIGGTRLIATVGIDNLIVVDSDDAVLICSKESTQDIKKITETLKICNRNELL